MKNKIIFYIFIFIFIISIASGCLELFTIDGSITYESHPTSIRYTISYGYKINCSGSGKYNIFYKCDIPELLKGQIIDIIVHNNDYYDEIIASWNNVKSWNITSNLNKEYDLGITANVQADSYMISDLNGKNALTIQDISNIYPDISRKFTQSQSNETTIFIDPKNPAISNIANQVLLNVDTNNSFLVAKELFKWLKQNTDYKIHFDNDNVQTAIYTLQCRSGDCDDLSFLYISLCRSINVPARFIRGFIVEENNAIPHAWVEVFVGGEIGDNGWIPVECAGIASTIDSEIHQNFGIEDVEHLRVFKDDGSNESLNVSLSGIYYRIYSTDRNIDAISYSNISNYYVLRNEKLIINENNRRTYE
ncbi:MAG: hypothetical protein AYK22_06355 [Thermoplasmatales archaeon SG8-52-3]|nr:MAG: hypothetical protein AYK22_06355 [Thermoplasmatales archaeon SG8-52-3]